MGKVQPKFNSVECYLKNCPLSIVAKKSVTLAHLGVQGTRQNPLNIFIIPFDADKEPDKVARLEILENLLRTMADDLTVAEQLLEALLKCTHFPPAVLALYELR